MKSIGRWEEERWSVGEEEGRSRREEVEGKEEVRRRGEALGEGHGWRRGRGNERRGGE